MKKLILICACIGLSLILHSQTDIFVDWEGSIKVPDGKIEIRVHFSGDQQDIKGLLDIPGQSAIGMQLSNINHSVDSLTFEFDPGNAKLIFNGKLYGDSICGDFIQGAFRSTFILYNSNVLPSKANTTFDEEEVEFFNQDIKLAGTLSLPKERDNPLPAIILLSGSGGQTRDGEIFGFKMFETIASYFSERGFAVLRYDDRGTGKSTGTLSSATTYDFASDAIMAVDFLKNDNRINTSKIGIIGHSEGGIIATIIASERDDISFIVQMAGTALPGKEVLLTQSRLISKAEKIPESQIEDAYLQNKTIYEGMMEDIPWTETKKLLSEYTDDRGPIPASKMLDLEKIYNSSWFREFLKIDPSCGFADITCPTLALFGGKDLQVDATANSSMFKQKFKEPDNNLRVVIFPEANHLFQKAETGLPSEYSILDKKFTDDFLEEIHTWLKAVLTGQSFFPEHTVVDNYVNTMSVQTADLDNDGDTDIVGAAWGGNSVDWWENNGKQEFIRHNIASDYEEALSVYAIDADDDNNVDILSTSSSNNIISLWLNDGESNFKEVIITDSILSPHSVYATDIDNDEDMDILCSSWGDDGVQWFENKGNLNYTRHIISAYSRVTHISAVDIDNDEDMDVLCTIYGDGKILLLENDGKQNFKEHSISFPGAHWAKAIDLDNDDDIDIIGASCGSSIAWWENVDNISFTYHSISEGFRCAAQISAADLDGDNDLDLIAAGEGANQVAWWENDGDQNFSIHPVSGFFRGASGVFAADIDNDNDIDILGAARFGNKICWWENRLLEFSDYSEMRSYLGKLFQQKKYDDAATVLEANINSFPDNLESNAFNLATVYTLIKKYDKAIKIIQFAHENNVWFNIYAFSSPLWDPLKKLDSFNTILLRNDELRLIAQKSAKSKYSVILPTGYIEGGKYPLFIALHGGGSNIDEFKQNWKSERMQDEFITLYIQSSQITSMNGFNWTEDIEISKKEISEAFKQVTHNYVIDKQNILIGGFSSGGVAALEVVLSNSIPTAGFIVLCPGKPDSFNDKILKKAKSRNIRGTIITSEMDPNLEIQKEMVARMEAVDIEHKFIITPNIGHWFPDDLDKKIDEAIRFASKTDL